MNKRKELVLTIFILLAISIGIGYAYLETDLNINSNVHIKKVVPIINYYKGDTLVKDIPSNDETYDYDTTKSNCNNGGELSWDYDN